MCILERGLAYHRAISMAGRDLASSQKDRCYGPFRMSASTWTRLQLSEVLFRKKTVIQWWFQHALVFKIAFNEADDSFLFYL